MTASMQVVDTPIDDVVVKFRLRSPSDKKVTNSTSNTTSNNTTISNPDPIVQMAFT